MHHKYAAPVDFIHLTVSFSLEQLISILPLGLIEPVGMGRITDYWCVSCLEKKHGMMRKVNSDERYRNSEFAVTLHASVLSLW